MMIIVDAAGAVSDVAFSGRGCAISQASASLLTDEIKGRPAAEIEAMTNQDILDLLGIEISPARLKCALLSLDTLQHALAEREEQGGHDRAPGGQRMTLELLGAMTRGSCECRRPATHAGV